MKRSMGAILQDQARLAGELNDAREALATEAAKTLALDLSRWATVERLEAAYVETKVDEIEKNERRRLVRTHSTRAAAFIEAAAAMRAIVNERTVAAADRARKEEHTREMNRKHQALVDGFGTR